MNSWTIRGHDLRNANSKDSNLLSLLEAAIGIEPMNKGFEGLFRSPFLTFSLETSRNAFDLLSHLRLFISD